MFTGLIADVGAVERLERSGEGARLAVASRLAAELRRGDSIAVNGACLTAVEAGEREFAIEAVNATLAATSLGELREGSAVNLELPLRPADRLGGHFVLGHVDGTGEVAELREDGFSRRARIAAGPELLRYIVARGSIAVDGVSLTVAEAGDDAFEVALIPETLRTTTLGELRAGQRVNLECDLLAKHLERLSTFDREEVSR